MKWSYGITTTKSRIGTYLQRTVDSLEAAGFECPRLFVDGWSDDANITNLGLPVSARDTPVGIVGNWMSAAWELYVREPESHRYAIFQDDILAVNNLKEYLERCQYPQSGYLNLYTTQENLNRSKGNQGWFLANQRGLGALGLVFNRDAIIEVLQSRHMAYKPCGANVPRRTTALDGGVLEAMKAAGFKEYCHNPSLVQHIGTESTVGHMLGGVKSFPGEDFDILKLVQGPNLEPCPGEDVPDRAPFRPMRVTKLERAIKIANVNGEVVYEWINEVCCEERKARLQSLDQWAKRVCRGKTEKCKQFLDTIMGRS